MRHDKESFVRGFLLQCGLRPSQSHVNTLSRVGLTTQGRIDGVAKLSQSNLDKVERHLKKEGLNPVACLLVLEAVKRRANV